MGAATVAGALGGAVGPLQLRSARHNPRRARKIKFFQFQDIHRHILEVRRKFPLMTCRAAVCCHAKQMCSSPAS